MSIIHEALKKTQNNLKTTSTPDAAHPMASVPKPEPHYAPQPPVRNTTPPPVLNQEQPKASVSSEKKPQTNENQHPANKILSFFKIIFVLAGLTALFIFQPYLTERLSSIASKSQNPAAPAVSAPMQQTAAQPAPAVQAATASVPAETPVIPIKPQLILNGISSTGIKAMALINNEIYEIGDDVNGLRVVNITEDGVELMDRDQRIFLKKRK